MSLKSYLYDPNTFGRISIHMDKFDATLTIMGLRIITKSMGQNYTKESLK